MSTRRSRILIVVLVIIAGACAAAVIVLPRWVKDRIIAAAAAQGVTLTIDDLVILPGHATITGIRATPLIRTDQKGAANVVVTAPKATVTLDGLTPTAITVDGAALVLEGSPSEVRAALASGHGQPAQGDSRWQRVSLHDASVTWKHPVDGKLIAPQAKHVALDVTRRDGRALGDDWHLEVPELHLWESPQNPYASVSADADAAGTRGTLTLGHGATLKVDVANAGRIALDADLPSTTPGELGIPATLLGLAGDEATHFELHVHHEQTDASHASGAIVTKASGIFLGASPARTDIAVDVKYAGDPAAGMNVTDGTLRAGPFSGPLHGGFSLPGGANVRADFHFESGAIACADAIKAQASQLGDLGKGVAALATYLGLDKAADGSIRLEGEVAIDTQDGKRHASFRTRGDCKLSYLPAP